MDSDASPRTLPAVVKQPSCHGATSSRRLTWRSGLAIAAFAALAVALGVAIDQRWLSLAALTPLLFTLPCAIMMFMCMRGMKHGSKTETSPFASPRQDD